MRDILASILGFVFIGAMYVFPFVGIAGLVIVPILHYVIALSLWWILVPLAMIGIAFCLFLISCQSIQ